MSERLPLAIASCDFRAAGASARQRLVLTDEEQAALFRDLEEQGVTGFALLHTCNRVEWLVSCQDPSWALQLLDATWTRRLHGTGLRAPATLLKGEAAVRHLFRVSAGLESLVQGEQEIRGQLRRALLAAQTAGRASAAFNILLSGLGRLAAKTRQRLGHRGSSPGMHSLAARLLDQRLEGSGSVAVVGMGEIGRRCAEALAERGYELTCFNRSLRGSASYRPLSDLPHHWSAFRGVVLCTASEHPVVGAEMLVDQGDPVVLDLGSPAQASEDVIEKLGGDYMGLDQFAAAMGCGLESKDYEALDRLVGEAVADYLERLAHHRFRGLAHSNQEVLEQVLREDLPDVLDQHTGPLSDGERRELEQDLRRLFRRQAGSIRESLVELHGDEEPAQFRLPQPETETC